MAALETPWLDHMSTPTPNPRNPDFDGSGPSDLTPPPSYAPPTYASFSPANLSSTTASAAKRRSTILVHQKSPLLLATPPQITRALAYSHPFLLPLNKLAGLVSWTTGDPWESFLLVAAFWAIVQYGNVVVRFAGPLVVVLGLIGGMYGRRFSPLSSSGWTDHPSSSGANSKGRNAGPSADGGGGHLRAGSNETTGTRHQKTLDEIVDTLKVFTTRCNILLEPLLEMTDFLSTQRTATSATTRPALTTLFVRLLAITPIWVALTLPPLRIITTKRVVLLFGTLGLTWHSRPCRVARTLLWRSATVRSIARIVTGLQFDDPQKNKAASAANGKLDGSKVTIGDITQRSNSALTAAIKRSRTGKMDSGVRFTFILYENQRRWVGLGWTSSLFAYERAAWTDEQNNPLPSKDKFELPEVDDAPAKWRWVEGSQWRVDGVPSKEETDFDGDAGRMGWIFYDNKWQNGRRGQDGWGRWTRRRKWYRDAELVEKTDDDDDDDAGNKKEPEPSTGASSKNLAQPPALPPRSTPASGVQTPSHNREKSDATISTLSTSLPSDTERDKLQSAAQQPKDNTDTASTLSTSTTKSTSRFRFPTPTLRRRVTGGSTHSQKQPPTSKQDEQGQPRPRKNSETGSVRSTSPTLNEEDEATFGSLTPALELEIQGRQRDQDAWGIGDEAVMGLE